MPFSSFVTVVGTRLYREGAPYRYLGANMWHAMHLGAEAGSSGERARLTRELDRLASLGVRNVRAMAASEGPDSEGWFARERESSLPGLSEVLRLGQRPTPWRVVPFRGSQVPSCPLHSVPCAHCPLRCVRALSLSLRLLGRCRR